MLNLCYTVGATLDVLFNATKSSLFAVGRLCDKTIDSLHIGNANIYWGKSLKYLGIYFQSDYSFKCDIDSSVYVGSMRLLMLLFIVIPDMSLNNCQSCFKWSHTAYH